MKMVNSSPQSTVTMTAMVLVTVLFCLGVHGGKVCHDAKLNGIYNVGSHTSYADGVNWDPWKSHYYSLRFSEIRLC